ncbi:metallophosphoesterase [Ilumatobacter coccineus]|uniref:metallophosphoesterase n=1 Tax=Ilumatobacter coccineus TaxID=467094 RepID=UPI000344EE8C|nr:metallophosphoesterase [Ilumatobacter coccineus]
MPVIAFTVEPTTTAASTIASSVPVIGGSVGPLVHDVLMLLCDTRFVALIGQLTDTHVLARDDQETEVFVDNNARLVDAVASIRAETTPVDVLIGTGDLANSGHPAEYEALLELLEPLDVPFLALGGNHDVRELLRSSFPGTPWVDAEHASWSTVVAGVRLVGLDSTTPGEHGGRLDEERCDWLDGVLRAPFDGPTLLAMHHPPFASGIRWMDMHGFPGLDLLDEVLTAHPVDRILCGHLHRPMASTFAGAPAQVGMSTVQHVALDLRPDAPVAVIDNPVGYQLIDVRPDSIVAHSRYIRTAAPVIPAWASEFDQ